LNESSVFYALTVSPGFGRVEISNKSDCLMFPRTQIRFRLRIIFFKIGLKYFEILNTLKSKDLKILFSTYIL